MPAIRVSHARIVDGAIQVILRTLLEVQQESDYGIFASLDLKLKYNMAQTHLQDVKHHANVSIVWRAVGKALVSFEDFRQSLAPLRMLGADTKLLQALKDLHEIHEGLYLSVPLGLRGLGSRA